MLLVLPTRDAAYCLKCRYALRGLGHTAVCPECGHAFDPDTPWTMYVPGWRNAVMRRAMPATKWRFTWARWAVVAVTIASAWFPAPNIVPTLALCSLWLAYAVPQLLKTLARNRIVNVYDLNPALARVDDAGVKRLRRMFGIAFVLVLLHVPFFASFAVSYPLFANSAHYWLIQAPNNESPSGPAMYGVMLVVDRHADMKSVSYVMIGGTLRFERDDAGQIRWSMMWPRDRARC